MMIGVQNVTVVPISYKGKKWTLLCEQLSEEKGFKGRILKVNRSSFQTLIQVLQD